MEQWKAIPTFPIYEASTLWRIRNSIEWNILKWWFDSNWYRKTHLSNKTKSTHRLIMLTFEWPCPPTQSEVCRCRCSAQSPSSAVCCSRTESSPGPQFAACGSSPGCSAAPSKDAATEAHVLGSVSPSPLAAFLAASRSVRLTTSFVRCAKSKSFLSLKAASYSNLWLCAQLQEFLVSVVSRSFLTHSFGWQSAQYLAAFRSAMSAVLWL